MPCFFSQSRAKRYITTIGIHKTKLHEHGETHNLLEKFQLQFMERASVQVRSSTLLVTHQKGEKKTEHKQFLKKLKTEKSQTKKKKKKQKNYLERKLLS